MACTEDSIEPKPVLQSTTWQQCYFDNQSPSLHGVPARFAFVLGLSLFSFSTLCQQKAIAATHDWTEPVSEEFVALFEPLEYEHSEGEDESRVFNYRLFVPANTNSQKKYPLLIWLHGHGERGDDNVLQLMHLDHLFTNPKNQNIYPFYLLAMQVPQEMDGWYSKSGTILSGDISTILLEVCDQVVATRPIDDDRIFLSGVSSGGTACWEIACRYPNRFAAIVPMSSSAQRLSRERYTSLAKLPIWAFHCSRDPTILPDSVRNLVASLDGVGGNVFLTELDSTSHDTWSEAFEHYDIMEWMLSHVRGKNVGFPPGVKPWHLLDFVLLPSAAIVLWLIWAYEKARRHKRPEKLSCSLDHLEEIP